MKTPILRKFESKLAEVNDQLCYFFFADAEVGKHLAIVTNGVDKEFTTDIFPENKFSERLHIKVDSLSSFREKAFHTLAGVSLIAAVEYMLCYIEEIENFRSKVSPSLHDAERDDKPEEQLKKKLEGWLGSDPESTIIKTIKYLRLRRNHIAHLSEEMSQDFSALIKDDAHLLNRYWGKKKTEIFDFNFSKTDYSTFSENEALALINLTRVCMKIIDENILSSLTKADIARYEIVKFLEQKSIKGLSLSTLSRKFRVALKLKYGISFECTEEEFEGYAQKMTW